MLLINGLSFTSEGYTRVKTILISKHGKSTEKVAAMFGV